MAKYTTSLNFWQGAYPAIYYFTHKIAESNRPKEKFKRSQGELLAHVEIFDRVGSLSNSCIRQICKIQL